MKNKIMFGIYLVYLVRKIKSPFVMEILSLAFLTATLSIFVSVPNVLSNMVSSEDLYNFFVIALSNTTLMVQLILIAGFLVLAKAIHTIRHLSSVGRARLS